ncbi:MAG TPA: transposase [Longimicrobiales bacterium]
MGRALRPHLPGGTFHIVARCQGREALFSPELRTALVGLLREHVAFSDAELFAYVVMPNHVHLVVQQGRAPLWRLMQPLLRRTALVVHRVYRRQGHVFERRYRSRPCSTPDHFRNAIVYTHLNPVRAGLCATPADYPWSSHGAWLGDDAAVDGRPSPVALARAATVFASAPVRTPGELCRDYLAFLEWRQACDDVLAGDAGAECAPSPEPAGPPVECGDANWAQFLAPPADGWGGDGRGSEAGGSRARVARPELATIAAAALKEVAPGLPSSMVRSRWGGPAYVRARRTIIVRAAAAGYRVREIAAYLRISTTAVSGVLTSERKRLLASSP